VRTDSLTTAPRDVMADDLYSFLVVEESLPTETIAEYRQSRASRARRAPFTERAGIVWRARWPRLAHRRAA
jgi:hypothetical protein